MGNVEPSHATAGAVLGFGAVAELLPTPPEMGVRGRLPFFLDENRRSEEEAEGAM